MSPRELELAGVKGYGPEALEAANEYRQLCAAAARQLEQTDATAWLCRMRAVKEEVRFPAETRYVTSRTIMASVEATSASAFASQKPSNRREAARVQHWLYYAQNKFRAAVGYGTRGRQVSNPNEKEVWDSLMEPISDRFSAEVRRAKEYFDFVADRADEQTGGRQIWSNIKESYAMGQLVVPGWNDMQNDLR